MPIAIPGIALAAAAILAVIILWATAVFAKSVAGLIPKDIPLIGKLHNIILAIGAVAIAALQWIMADIIGPAFAFIAKPVLAIVQFIESVQQLARTMATSWLWLLNSALPAIIKKLQTYAHTLVVAARAYALSLYHRVQKYAHDLVHAARVYTLSLYHKAIAYAHDVGRAIKAYAHDLVHIEEVARVAAVAAAKVYAHDLVHAVEGELGTVRKALENEIKAITSVTLPDVTKAIAVGVREAEDFANVAAGAAVGILTTDVTAVVAGLFDGLITDVGALADVISTDLPDIGDAVRAIPRSIPLDIAGTIGLSIALERVAVRYMARCGIPNCRNLSKIGRDLQELFGAIEGAAFLGLVGYMVANPDGAAREAADVLGGMANELADTAKHLVGM
jgi:hypothetical protein